MESELLEIQDLDMLIYRRGCNLYFNAEIDEYEAIERLIQLSFDLLDDKDCKEYRLYLDTPGGYTSAAFKYYNHVRLEVLPRIPKAEAIINGFCLSAGVNILCSFPVRKGISLSTLMVHESSVGIALQPLCKAENEIKLLKKIEDYANEMIINATGLDKEAFIKILDKSEFLTMSDALELGFIQEIL